MMTAGMSKLQAMKRLALMIGFLSAFVFFQTAQAQNTDNFTATVGALDKITARTTELDLPANSRVKFGTLWLTAKACFKRPPTEPPEIYIYLIIDDVLADGTEVQVFQGWMLATSPALSAMEHAVYDVWAIDCRTAAPSASSAN